MAKTLQAYLAERTDLERRISEEAAQIGKPLDALHRRMAPLQKKLSVLEEGAERLQAPLNALTGELRALTLPTAVGPWQILSYKRGRSEFIGNRYQVWPINSPPTWQTPHIWLRRVLDSGYSSSGQWKCRSNFWQPLELPLEVFQPDDPTQFDRMKAIIDEKLHATDLLILDTPEEVALYRQLKWGQSG